MKLWFASCPGNHRHKCCQCQQVWEHSDDFGGSTEAHTCPACGKVPDQGNPEDTGWMKYLGADDPGCIKTDAYVWPGAQPVLFDACHPEVARYVAKFDQMCRMS